MGTYTFLLQASPLLTFIVHALRPACYICPGMHALILLSTKRIAPSTVKPCLGIPRCWYLAKNTFLWLTWKDYHTGNNITWCSLLVPMLLRYLLHIMTSKKSPMTLVRFNLLADFASKVENLSLLVNRRIFQVVYEWLIIGLQSPGIHVYSDLGDERQWSS